MFVADRSNAARLPRFDQLNASLPRERDVTTPTSSLVRDGRVWRHSTHSLPRAWGEEDPVQSPKQANKPRFSLRLPRLRRDASSPPKDKHSRGSEAGDAQARGATAPRALSDLGVVRVQVEADDSSSSLAHRLAPRKRLRRFADADVTPVDGSRDVTGVIDPNVEQSTQTPPISVLSQAAASASLDLDTASRVTSSLAKRQVHKSEHVDGAGVGKREKLKTAYEKLLKSRTPQHDDVGATCYSGHSQNDVRESLKTSASGDDVTNAAIECDSLNLTQSDAKSLTDYENSLSDVTEFERFELVRRAQVRDDSASLQVERGSRAGSSPRGSTLSASSSHAVSARPSMPHAVLPWRPVATSAANATSAHGVRWKVARRKRQQAPSRNALLRDATPNIAPVPLPGLASADDVTPVLEPDASAISQRTCVFDVSSPQRDSMTLYDAKPRSVATARPCDGRNDKPAHDETRPGLQRVSFEPSQVKSRSINAGRRQAWSGKDDVSTAGREVLSFQPLTSKHRSSV